MLGVRYQFSRIVWKHDKALIVLRLHLHGNDNNNDTSAGDDVLLCNVRVREGTGSSSDMGRRVEPFQQIGPFHYCQFPLVLSYVRSDGGE